MRCDRIFFNTIAFGKMATGGLVALLLSGCASVEAVRPDIAAKPMPSRLDEIALINELRSAYVVVADDTSLDQSLCFDGTGLTAFKSKSGQGYRQKVDPENEGTGCFKFRSVQADDAGKADLIRYMSAGFTLTDIYCQRFFTVAAASERNRNFGRALNNGIDTLVGSVLTLSGAGATATGITNSGFGLIDEGLAAYDTAYLVGPDLSEVRRLVAAAQVQYSDQAIADAKTFPPTYAAARAKIERYASLCSYTGMKELVDKAVKDKTDQLSTGSEGTLVQPGDSSSNETTEQDEGDSAAQDEQEEDGEG